MPYLAFDKSNTNYRGIKRSLTYSYTKKNVCLSRDGPLWNKIGSVKFLLNSNIRH